MREWVFSNQLHRNWQQPLAADWGIHIFPSAGCQQVSKAYVPEALLLGHCGLHEQTSC